jgi:hypothetical protein
MQSFTELVAGTALSECFAYWASKIRNGVIPSRGAIDPLEIPSRLLPDLFIYEPVAGDYRCRLAGTGLQQLFGWESTGRFLSQSIKDPEIRGSRTRLLDRCLHEQVAVVYVAAVIRPAAEAPWRSYRRLLLPLAPTPEWPPMIFGIVVRDSANPHPPERGARVSEVLMEATCSPLEFADLTGDEAAAA